MSAYGDLLSFSAPGETDKTAGLWCAEMGGGGGSQYPGLQYARVRENMNENGNKNVNEKYKIPIFYIVLELMFHIGPLTLNK